MSLVLITDYFLAGGSDEILKIDDFSSCVLKDYRQKYI